MYDADVAWRRGWGIEDALPTAEKEEVARMRRIVMLAVVALMMALMMALSGTALAANGELNEEQLCALAARAILIGQVRGTPPTLPPATTPGEILPTCVAA